MYLYPAAYAGKETSQLRFCLIGETVYGEQAPIIRALRIGKPDEVYACCTAVGDDYLCIYFRGFHVTRYEESLLVMMQGDIRHFLYYLHKRIRCVFAHIKAALFSHLSDDVL